MPLNMPTQQSVGHDSHAASIDTFNRELRAQPWYQAWFRQQGLDPNHVHLSQGQRKQLEQLILQQDGVPPDAFNDMMIDPAGNLNTEHGFAAQPTWAKALEIGGAAAAGGYFAAPYLSGAGAASGGSGASAAGVGSGAGVGATGAGVAGAGIPTIGSTAIGSGMAGAAPSLAGATTLAGGATVGGSALGTLGAGSRISQALQLGGRLAGGASDQRSADRASQANYNVYADRARLDAESQKLHRLTGADLIQGWQPPTDPRAQKFLTTANTISPETLAAMRDTSRLQPSPYPQAGKGDKALNALDWAGTGLRAWDILKGMR